jgi:hypothetical protein
MWPLSFWAWFASLSMMSSSSIHLPANDIISFFMSEYYFSVYIYHISFNPFFSCKASGLFSQLGYYKFCCKRKKKKKTHGWASVYIVSWLMFLWIYIQSGTAILSGRSFLVFLWNLHIAFHSGYPNLHSRQQCKGSLHSDWS